MKTDGVIAVELSSSMTLPIVEVHAIELAQYLCPLETGLFCFPETVVLQRMGILSNSFSCF